MRTNQQTKEGNKTSPISVFILTWFLALFTGCSGVYKGEWNTGTTYHPGDTVVQGDKGYAAKQRNLGSAPQGNPDIWSLIVNSNAPSVMKSITKGEDLSSDAGVGYVLYQGPWDSGTRYRQGQIVIEGDQAYEAKQLNIGAKPSANASTWTHLGATNDTAVASLVSKGGTLKVGTADLLPILSPPVFFITGAKFQNPYTISYDQTKNTATLEKNGSGTVGFLEFAWMRRFALVGDHDYPPSGPRLFGGNLVNPFSHMFDIEGHLGFVFGNNNSPTNFSASTIAGGGDFYANLCLGFPIWRRLGDNTRQQITIEGGGGASTDKDFLQVHSIATVGLAYQLGYTNSPVSADKDRPGIFAFRFGMAIVDNPRVTSTATNLTVAVDGGLPEFDHQWVPALGVYLIHPLLHGVYLTASANLYSFRQIYGGHTGPDQWNIAVGVSIPFDTFSSMFAIPFKSD